MSDAPLVIFDIGSTLVSGPPEGPAARIAEQLRLSADEKRVLHTALMTREFKCPAEVCEFIEQSLDRPGDSGDAFIQELWNAQESETRAVEGATEALAELHDRGLRLGLISNIWQPYLTSVWRDFGEVFDRCVAKDLQLFSFQVGHAKPSAEIFKRALSVRGSPAASTVMVGDSYREDIQPAMDLGMVAIWVLSRPEKESDARKRVQNGSARRPSATVSSVTALDEELVLKTIESSAERDGFGDSVG